MAAIDITLAQCFIAVDDHDKALAFYRDMLGLEVRDDVTYEGMRWETVGPPSQPGVESCSSRRSPTPTPLPPTASRWRTCWPRPPERRQLPHRGLRATFEQIRSGGGDLHQEPMDMPYGVRDCAFRDPAGHMLRICQPRR